MTIELSQQESELRYRRLFEAAQDGILILDAETGMIEDVNPFLIKMLGYSREEFVKRKLWEVGAFQDMEANRNAFEALQVDEYIRYEDLPLRAKNGALVEVEFVSNVYMVGSGKVVQCNIRNITERKQAEKSLHEKERLLSEAQKIGRMGSWSYSIPTDNLQYTDEMYRLFDVSAQEFQHNKAGLLALILAADQPKVQKWLDEIIAGRLVKELDFRLFHKSGELHYLQSRGTAQFDPLGNPVAFIGIAQDISDRKLAGIQIHQQIERLTSLGRIDKAIISTFDLGIMMETVLSQVISQLQVDAADILLLDHDSQTLEYLTGSGFSTKGSERAHVPFGRSLAGRAAKEQHTIRVDDLREQPDDSFVSELVVKVGFVTYFGVPLISRGKVKGVLEVFHRTSLYPYAEWVDFLNTLAGQAAIAIENAALFTNLEQSNKELSQAYDATIEGWSRALDLRDKETEGHTLRVTELTLRLASEFAFTKTQMLHIRWGALLHDIGKMGIPDKILLKPDELSEEESAIMRKHPQYSYDLLQPIAFLLPALDIPYCHHEKWDGTGYPRGLKGEEIPLQARVFTVVDVWDALCSDRPYRPGWPEQKVLDYILTQSGSYFDPQVVDTFIDMQKKK
jgi:PAS domain S-box-containing protein/putative nucleotidyltransferase with HDIG domain